MKYVDVNILKPNKLNPRKITIRQVEKLSASLKENPEYFEAQPLISYDFSVKNRRIRTKP